jgi:uncharacterized membrane protein
MPTPLLRDLIGSVTTVTSANALANNGYANSADKLTIDNATNLALLADFDLTGTFATAPVGGVIQLVAVDYSLDGSTAGPTPASTMLGRVVGSFSPQPNTSNSSTSWRMRLNAIPLTNKTDFYLFNNGTGFSLNSGWVLKSQCWSPGT